MAKVEEKKEQLAIDEADAKWNISLFQPVANFMAGPGGGAIPSGNKPNQAISALAGGLSGAASGAAIGSAATSGSAAGGIYGAVIGAAIGVGLSFAQ